MRFAVRHETVYRYDVPVRLSNHVVRLTPRPGQGQLNYHDVMVDPIPARRYFQDDRYGNRLLQLEFNGVCNQLRVESRFELFTFPVAPIEVAFSPLPWASAMPTPPDPSVSSFAQDVAMQAHYDPLAFLDVLGQRLFTRLGNGAMRTSGDANPAGVTLAQGGGTCRDLAVLFMEAARAMGMPSRFVSGYQAHGGFDEAPRHMHAWAEVELPGLGFRGWDATQACRVDERYVALCAGMTQPETMPVEGGYFFDASTLNTTLDYTLHIAH